jgi:hypothetical protein
MKQELSVPRKLRLWPGVLAVTLQWLTMFGLPVFLPEQGGTAILAGVAGALVVLPWWILFSRAPWLERIGAVAMMVPAVAVTSRLVHESIANGMMGFMLYVYAAPLLTLALVAWAVASRHASTPARHASMACAMFLGCGSLTLVRTDGITGDAISDFEWRWTPTAEQKLLARTTENPSPTRPAAADAAPETVPPSVESTVIPAQPATAITEAAPAPSEHGLMRVEWPGFRGPMRDSVVLGVTIETDWSSNPPKELWRRPIGPGWSSFAVSTGRLFTQEQRGEDEVVSAYDLKSGEPVWTHRDAARFWESNAGPGPRATPTIDNGRVYTLGATGILNALDIRDGRVLWSRNAATDTGARIPDWGIASSPLAVGDIVVAATAGSLAAYEASTGNLRWLGPKGGWGYSSPHAATIDGIEQIVLVNGPGAIGVSPPDGVVLWKYAWAGDSIVQPAVLAGGDLLIGSGSGLADKTGMVRVGVTHDGPQWTLKERWTSSALKAYFNDFVVHEGHAFGFDGSILACIDLEDGARKWKGGRYGHGQLILLADQDLLIVLSEGGELALVSAAPDKFTELARVSVLEGKTWNHPVLAGDLLLVRNGEQMAAFRLPVPRH